MSFMGVLGALLIFSGAFHLTTYLKRKRWPVVEGSLDSVDAKIEATAPTEGVGFFVRPKFIHKIRYSYHGSSLELREAVHLRLELRDTSLIFNVSEEIEPVYNSAKEQ